MGFKIEWISEEKSVACQFINAYDAFVKQLLKEKKQESKYYITQSITLSGKEVYELGDVIANTLVGMDGSKPEHLTKLRLLQQKLRDNYEVDDVSIKKEDK